MFLLPLAYSWGTYDRWVLPKLLLARLLVITLLVLYAARALRQRRLVVKRSPLDLPWAAFLISAAISTVLAVNVNVAIFGTYSRYDGLLTIATYAALFWLGVQSIDGPEDARALLRFLLAGAYAVAVVAVIQAVVDASESGSIGHAYGSLGHWNVLGAFLAMTWPLALWEASLARSIEGKIIAGNVAAAVGLALVLTFSRSAWVGAVVATVILLLGARKARLRRVVAVGAVTAVALGIVIAGLGLLGGSGFEVAVAERAQTILHPSEWGPRMLIWQDSVKLIAARPLVGFGPDTFGLVFPQYNDSYHAELLDKAHAEILQIAATQGLIGLAAYGWMALETVRTFWHGKKMPGAFAVLAAVAGYEVTLQVNFTSLGSAFPFWIVAAAAMHRWNGVSATPPMPITSFGANALRIAIAASSLAVAAGVVLPFLADTRLEAAVEADRAGNGSGARSAASQAIQLSPRESVYAVEVGNVAYERGDWEKARDAYTLAAQLGTYNPMVYRNLALADRNLGLTSEGRAAAIAAYRLDRFDPANQALLAEFDVHP